MSPEPIQLSVRLKATPEEVFDAFTVKEDLEAWFANTATLSAEEGGAWRYTWPPHVAAAGHFLTVDRPHELIWTWEESIEDDTVFPLPESGHAVATNRYTFEPDGDGTIFHLEESGHDNEEVRQMNVDGIKEMIRALRAWVERGERVNWAASSSE